MLAMSWVVELQMIFIFLWVFFCANFSIMIMHYFENRENSNKCDLKKEIHIFKKESEKRKKGASWVFRRLYHIP